MNRNRFLLFLFLLSLAVAGCAPSSPEPAADASASSASGPDAEALLQREQQRVTYLVEGDFDRLGEMLSSTLSYTHSNAALDSKDSFLGDLRSGQVVYRSMKHRDVGVRFVTPEVAILNGLTDASVTVGGQDQEVPLRFTIVYVVRDGEWLVEAWHSVRRPQA